MKNSVSPLDKSKNKAEDADENEEETIFQRRPQFRFEENNKEDFSNAIFQQ